jgi:hypothetical protein
MLKSLPMALLAAGLLLTAGAGAAFASHPVSNPSTLTAPADEQCGTNADTQVDQTGDVEDADATDTCDTAENETTAPAAPETVGATPDTHADETAATGTAPATGATDDQETDDQGTDD